MIAGHTFALSGRCACGRTWAEIAASTEADIGQRDIAHSGLLNMEEVMEIAAERERQWAALKAAVAA